MRTFRYLFGHRFRYAFDVDLRACAAGALRDGLSHLLDMSVRRIVENKNLSHRNLLRVMKRAIMAPRGCSRCPAKDDPGPSRMSLLCGRPARRDGYRSSMRLRH